MVMLYVEHDPCANEGMYGEARMVEADSCGSLKYWQFRAKSLAKLRTSADTR